MNIYEEIPLWDKSQKQPEPNIEPFLLSGENRPCVIICPGGGYVSLAEHEGKNYAEYFNSIGMSAFVLTYRLIPYAHPAQLLDAQRAVRYVRYHADRFGIDADRIVICGSSAGGHLSAMTACFADDGTDGDSVDNTSSRVAAVILCYPVVSLDEYCDGLKWCTDVLTQKDKTAEHDLSIQNLANKDVPPIFVWHTLDDETVNINHTLLLAARCRELGVPLEAHIFPTGYHGMGLAETDAHIHQWAGLCEKWLKYNNIL